MTAAVDVLKLDTADEVARWLRIDYPTISPRQIRQWARRGHITRHSGDLYHAPEVATYLETRDPRMVEIRSGVCAGQSRDTFPAKSRVP